MSMELSFSLLRLANVRRNAVAFPECAAWTGTDWACALAGETGEACNVVKKLRRGGVGEDKRVELHAQLAKELADVITYADLLADHFGIDLGKAVVEKYNEVSRRRNCLGEFSL